MAGTVDLAAVQPQKGLRVLAQNMQDRRTARPLYIIEVAALYRGRHITQCLFTCKLVPGAVDLFIFIAHAHIARARFQRFACAKAGKIGRLYRRRDHQRLAGQHPYPHLYGKPRVQLK
ncbi:hypothetical protein SDC9_165087 [bioreactor metagenome]|uniref:Uncharacterized protein n=1 Tax=bioreactor metagenome TaxID=1076179 RepID=A0A645FVQ8_9ZZZZ